MRKPAFCICENKDADQLRGNREADRRLFFAIRIVQSLYYLRPKFQASNHLLSQYSLVCVGPGRKPRRPVFSQRGSFYKDLTEINARCRSTNLYWKIVFKYGGEHVLIFYGNTPTRDGNLILYCGQTFAS